MAFARGCWRSRRANHGCIAHVFLALLESHVLAAALPVARLLLEEFPADVVCLDPLRDAVVARIEGAGAWPAVTLAVGSGGVEVDVAARSAAVAIETAVATVLAARAATVIAASTALSAVGGKAAAA